MFTSRENSHKNRPRVAQATRGQPSTQAWRTTMSNLLEGKRVLITGVGFKPVRYVFRDIESGRPSHTAIVVDGVEYKANIGAAAAMECAKAGAQVCISARSGENMMAVKKWIEESVVNSEVDFCTADLTNHADVQRLAHYREDCGRDLYWVQSVGLGAGTVCVKNDNPYVPIDELTKELITAELSVLENTVSMLQALLPRFREQKETRVCIVSSMSAVRSVISGSIHMAAKGAISRFTNAASIELNKDKIFVTDVRPGIVDTGLYDSEVVQKTVQRMAATYGYDFADSLRCMPPTAVAKAIVMALSSEAHITSINMVARGQWPHEGS